MAWDEDLAARVREQLADEPTLREKPMFGGLAFLVEGHMAVAASRHGGLMARVDAEASDALLDPPAVTRMVMRGREMDGWLLVAPEALEGRALDDWVARGLAAVRSL